MSDESKDRERDEPSYDDREIDARAITLFSVGVMVLCLLSFGGALWLMAALEAGVDERHEPPPRAATARPTAPEGPLLQAKPEEGLAALRAEEDERLGSYGYVDRASGRVRIPIERAMDLLAERGLPVREDAPPREEAVSQPTESGLGVASPPRGEAAK